MNNWITHRLSLLIYFVAATIVTDQCSKVFVREHLPLGLPNFYLGGLLRIEHSENTGAFLSLGAGLSESMRFWIFIVITGAFLVVAGIYLYKTSQTKLAAIATGLVVGGGIGNLIDRSMQGPVTDFMLLGLGPLKTGIFNFADLYIVIGVGLLFLESHLQSKAQKLKDTR